MIIVNIIGLEFRDIQRSENSNFKTSELQNMGCFVVHSFFIYFFALNLSLAQLYVYAKTPSFQAILVSFTTIYYIFLHVF